MRSYNSYITFYISEVLTLKSKLCFNHLVINYDITETLPSYDSLFRTDTHNPPDTHDRERTTYTNYAEDQVPPQPPYTPSDTNDVPSIDMSQNYPQYSIQEPSTSQARYTAKYYPFPVAQMSDNW